MTKISKERGLPFMADMVRAVRDGTKTQTRRICKLPHQNPLGQWEPTTFGGPNGGRTSKGETIPEHAAIWHTRTGDCISARYAAGDRLWVRENWRTVEAADKTPPRDLTAAHRIWFEADAPHQPGFGKFRPGMFMCRWMSRILLEVVSVRVERLQDISRGDAMGEGCPFPNMAQGDDPRQWYADLWEQINGPGSWAVNPWVWVVEFKRITP